ncbi:MAG TPA: TMEM175 family protein [Chloroflexia bacterium]|nr:TMEM175 family protein [Chloroflexia bacterium]
MTSNSEHQTADELKETGRIEAFSDGVFAIAITLLILNIQVPHDTAAGGLWPALGAQAATYLAFLTSFATIGIMWINHHRLFMHIKRSDNQLLALNLLLLLGVTVLPFPTALVAEYIQKPACPADGWGQLLSCDQKIAALVYGGTCILIAIFFNLLWRYAAYENRLLDKHANVRAVRAISRQYAVGPVLYALTFGVALLNPWVSLAGNLALAVFFALPGRPPP